MPDHLTVKPVSFAASARFAILLSAVFVAGLLFRSPGLLLDARMWAEEGSLYYSALQDPSSASPWTLVVRGNFQLPLNMAAALAVRVPAQWAAHVTTGIALSVALVMVCLIGRLAEERSWRPWPTCALVLAVALLPQGYEIYLTATNLQWLASVSMLLLAVLAVAAWPRWQQVLALLWSALCAFSGVPAVMLAPVLLARGILDRSRPHLAMGAMLAVGALMQLAIIMTHSQEERAFTLDPYVTIVGFLAQAMVAPLFGVSPTTWYLLQMRADNTWMLPVLIASTVGGAWVVFRSLAVLPGGTRFATTLGAGAVLCTVLNVLGALGPKDQLATAWAGGRYFMLAAVSWLLWICAAAHSPTPWVRRAAVACLALSILSGGAEALANRWQGFMVSGPSWRATVQACGTRRPCEVQVWPGGPSWTFMLTRP